MVIFRLMQFVLHPRFASTARGSGRRSLTAQSMAFVVALTGLALASPNGWANPTPSTAGLENPTPSAAERTLESLRAADQARSTDATETQAWAEEEARLKLLLTAIEERTAAARRREKRAREELRAAQETRPAQPIDLLELGAIRVARRIDEGLDTLAKQVPPGLIPPRDPGRADARKALDQALHRLERAERATEVVSVSIAPGRLNGEPKSVEVLRLGGVAAWWRSLDGQIGGEAQMVDGQLVLHSTTDPARLDAIGRASAIAKGRQAPEILLLPVRYARTSTGGQP